MILTLAETAAELSLPTSAVEQHYNDAVYAVTERAGAYTTRPVTAYWELDKPVTRIQSKRRMHTLTALTLNDTDILHSAYIDRERYIKRQYMQPFFRRVTATFAPYDDAHQRNGVISRLTRLNYAYEGVQSSGDIGSRAHYQFNLERNRLLSELHSGIGFLPYREVVSVDLQPLTPSATAITYYAGVGAPVYTSPLSTEQSSVTFTVPNTLVAGDRIWFAVPQTHSVNISIGNLLITGAFAESTVRIGGLAYNLYQSLPQTERARGVVYTLEFA